MSKPDINLLSFNGPDDNGRDVDMRDTVLEGAGYSDTIKCSTRLTGFTGKFGEVRSGAEDALDINNRCTGIDITASVFVLRGTMGITAKGGSHDIRISGMIEGCGKECDVDLGNHSDQSRIKTSGVHLNLRRADGAPVRVRVLNSDVPTFEPGSGPYVYVFPSPKLGILHKLIVWVFVTYHRIF